MLEYAAFNAARAGSVWNADENRMQTAAVMSLIPTAPTWPVGDGILPVGPIKDLGEMATAAGKIALKNWSLGAAFPIVSIDILSPTQEDVPRGQVELDFDAASDSYEARKLSQLTIRVTYFYNLYIPFANRVIWRTWYASRASYLGLANTILDFFEIDGHGGRSGGPFLAFYYPGQNSYEAEFLAAGLRALFGSSFSNPYECLNFIDWAMVVAKSRSFLGTTDSYYLPLVTMHTIRMQSNHYKGNLPTKEEASCSGHT